MKFAAFQRAVHETEPRGIVILTAALVDVLPHIAVQGQDFALNVRVYARGRLVDLAGNLDPDVAGKVEAEGLFADASESVPLLPLVKRALDDGDWLVVPDPSEVESAVWRDVGRLLVMAVPEERNYLTRRQFRLFTFVQPGQNLPEILPPLICQYAFVVDNAGAVKTRAQLGPLFDGTVTMQGYRALADFSKNDAEVQNSMYVQLLLASMRSNTPASEEARVPATEPVYINEVLFRLRESLIDQQQLLLADAQSADRDADAAFEAAVARQREKFGDEYDEQKDRNAHNARVTAEKQLSQNYDWIYHKTLEWLVAQCPDADLSNVPTVVADDVVLGDVIWVRDDEECLEGLWCGCPVAVKRPLVSLSSEAAAARRKQFDVEVGRHATFRHPHIVSLFGVTNALHSNHVEHLIMEATTGTLEQELIAARFEGVRWTVGRFLDMCCDVLKGMAYLATNSVHRDISTRSIVSCGGKYKVGQFACSLPLSHVDSEAKRGMVPVRWTAPEGFAGLFSPMSDMWSFGIMVWTAMQYSTAQPYAEEAFPPDAITRGAIPPCVRECPPLLYYDVILPCLVRDPGSRPAASKCLLSVELIKRTIPVAQLQAEVPFPGDECSFDDWQLRRRAQFDR